MTIPLLPASRLEPGKPLPAQTSPSAARNLVRTWPVSRIVAILILVSEPNESLVTRNEIVSTTVETGGAVIGSLVGLALGGPVGAIIGAATPPLLTRATGVARGIWVRRQERASRVVTAAIDGTGISADELVSILESSSGIADDFAQLIDEASKSDPAFETIFATLTVEILSDTARRRERALIIADAVSGMRSTHLSVLLALSSAEEPLTPDQLSARIGLSAVELRSVVRSLEVRAMIKDVGADHVKWQIRELGQGVVDAARSRNS